MIDSKIVKIASFTKNAGLRNNFTHRSSIKNSLCGDFIKTEFIAHDSKVKSSCIKAQPVHLQVDGKVTPGVPVTYY